MNEPLRSEIDRSAGELLFLLLGLWSVDLFGQVQRFVGFRRPRGRGARSVQAWQVAVETSDLSDMLPISEVRRTALSLLTGNAESGTEWSEHTLPLISYRLQEQGIVLCQHLSDAVCIARARRYWRDPFETSGIGSLWSRAERQERRLYRLILLRRAARAGLPPEAVDLLRSYLEAAEIEPRYRSESYRTIGKRVYDERDLLGTAVRVFVKQHDGDVWRRAHFLWDRFKERFLGVRERRLERWCAVRPGVAYCRPAGRLDRQGLDEAQAHDAAPPE